MLSPTSPKVVSSAQRAVARRPLLSLLGGLAVVLLVVSAFNYSGDNQALLGRFVERTYLRAPVITMESAPLPTILDAQSALEAAHVAAGVTVSEGNSLQVLQQTMYYASLAQSDWIDTICETGFNGGHSSVTWLSSNQHAVLYSFDLPHPDYGPPARAHVKSAFPGRFQITDGDSTVTLPKYRVEHPDLKCDLIHVDGGHSYDVALADLRNFQPLANPHRHVLLMDDLDCDAFYCVEPVKAWKTAVAEGWVKERACFNFHGKSRGWCVGEYVFSDVK
ncbi:hypothetical protein HDU93_006898 [Gonapodya sp. JEL0774]|nr:hypothetical protein HDU93_006898 [Gonapodya sp. JEL0774]